MSVGRSAAAAHGSFSPKPFLEKAGRRHFMIENKKPNSTMTEQQKQRIIEGLWLTYYNDTLYAKGVITEEARNKMRLRIKARTSALER
jgi:hypothetical protein